MRTIEEASRPYLRELCAAIQEMRSLLLPGGYRLDAQALSTYEGLCDEFYRCGRFTVWNGASSHTIFGASHVNYEFRAWHDYCHIIGGFDFSPEGEAQTCAMQIAQLKRRYSGVLRHQWWELILDAEINGQGKYLAMHGEFPHYQRGFVLGYIEDKATALSQQWN